MNYRLPDLDELPKTISGMIRRVELRQRDVSVSDSRPAGEFRDEDFDLTR